MPLRDHFRPPLDDRHSWDEVHGLWPAMVVLQLARILPPEYYAAPQIYLGGSVEIDIGTFERDEVGNSFSSAGENSSTATAIWTGAEPTLRVETDVPHFDEYEVRVYDVKRERRLVATIELVSPANKDSPERGKHS